MPDAEGSGWSVVVDLSRALSDVQSSPPTEQIKHLSRLMAAEAYQRAWAEYRAGSPAWQRRDASLGQLEPLMHRVAEAGPVAIYSVDENFFPLAVWLKQSMREEPRRVEPRRRPPHVGRGRARSAHGHRRRDPEAGVHGERRGALGRLSRATGSSRRSAWTPTATALAGGPRAFFEAYGKAADKKGSGLMPLGKAIREQLAAPPPSS